MSLLRATSCRAAYRAFSATRHAFVSRPIHLVFLRVFRLFRYLSRCGEFTQMVEASHELRRHRLGHCRYLFQGLSRISHQRPRLVSSKRSFDSTLFTLETLSSNATPSQSTCLCTYIQRSTVRARLCKACPPIKLAVS